MSRRTRPRPESKQADPLAPEVDGLTYRLDAPPRRHGKKSVVTVRLAGPDPGPPLVDRADMFSFRSRRALAQLVADTFGRRVDEIMGHLALVLDQAERAQAQEAAPVEVVSPERRVAAEKLLRAPDLLDQVARAMEQVGHVGEDQVKRIAYLVATSRLLPRPLNTLLLAPSGTGKSAILEAVAALMPPEHVVSVARLTPQSLFYMGKDALRHKLVLVDEYQGQAEADHAIRVLQSRGELTLTATVKGKAESITVRGPVAVMSGTVSTSIDVQNLTRVVELPLDDSVEQTKRVQAAQARAWTGRTQSLDLVAWQDAQRLLEACDVVIPFAERLVFPARTTADRRTSAKLLGLVGAHALLYQRRRERDPLGRVVAIQDDYRGIHDLLRPLAAQALDGLSPRAVRAYRAVAEAKRAVTRRELAEHLGWSYNTAKAALGELLDQELLSVADRGPPTHYRVLERNGLGIGTDLLDPAALD